MGEMAWNREGGKEVIVLLVASREFGELAS